MPDKAGIIIPLSTGEDTETERSRSYTELENNRAGMHTQFCLLLDPFITPPHTFTDRCKKADQERLRHRGQSVQRPGGATSARQEGAREQWWEKGGRLEKWSGVGPSQDFGLSLLNPHPPWAGK